MKSNAKQIGQFSLYFGAGLTIHCIEQGSGSLSVIAGTLGLSTHVVQGIFSIGNDILKHGVYNSWIKAKEGFKGDVNHDLENAIINAYTKTISKIQDEIIEEYNLKESISEKLIRYIFNKESDNREALTEVRINFLTPLLKNLSSDDVISEMLKDDEQLNPDEFLRRIITTVIPDYVKTDNELTTQFVNIVCEKFKKNFSHYFLQELKSNENAKTVYYTHLLEGIILNTKNIKKDLQIIIDFASQASQKLPEIIQEVKEVNNNVNEIKKVLADYQNDIVSKIDFIKNNLKDLNNPFLDKRDQAKNINNNNKFDFKYGYLDFVGRNEELSRLWNFIGTKDSDKKFLWWLVTGPGGMGKSRIAQKLCMMASGYYSGFFDFYNNLNLNTKWETWKPEMPTLIIIDYALAKSEKVIELITILERRSKEYLNPVRLILLDREETKQWRKKILSGSEVEHSLFKEFENSEIFKLEMQPLKEEYQWKILEQVIKRENKPIWEDVEFQKTEILKKVIELDKKCRPLFTFLTAMALANGESIRNWNTNKLLERTFSRFEEMWWKYVDDKELREKIKYILLINTFCNELNKKEIDNLLTEFKLNITYGDFEDLYSLISNCNTKDGVEVWEGLKPDILGEYFILETIQNILNNEPNNGEKIVSHLLNTALRLNCGETCYISFMCSKDFQISDKNTVYKFDLLKYLYKQNITSDNNYKKFLYTVLYMRGLEYGKLNRLEDGIDDFDMSISLDDKYGKVFFDRGSFKLRLDQTDDALKDFTKASELNVVNDVVSYMMILEKTRGLHTTTKLQYDEAIKICNKAIKAYDKNAIFYFLRGMNKYFLSQYDSAILDFSKAIELHSTYESFYNDKTAHKMIIDENDLWISDMLNAIDLEASLIKEGSYSYSECFCVRGIMYQKIGKKKDACKDFKTSMELGNKRAGEYYQLHCSNKPITATEKYTRNQLVSVQYFDGTKKMSIKYKIVEGDIEAGKCIVIVN